MVHRVLSRQLHFGGPARRLGYIGLASVLFFTVSGGPYGLEPLVAALNPGWAVVLIVATPIFWGLPIALMVAELSSALPDEGGYYVWVRRTLGPFWGVQEGWWSICAIAVDMALYPVLFVDRAPGLVSKPGTVRDKRVELP